MVLVFLALNYRAWDGYFQDDELDNLSWAPALHVREYAHALVKPTFDASNFRPVGHAFFTLMGRGFGLDFPPYITPIFLVHFLNGLLLFLLLRRLRIAPAFALGGAAFFLLSGSAMDAYWKPMYVFDLFCTTFCLLSILLWTHRRWVLSFVAFWLAYKAKELAVMLPIVLLAWEFWFGETAGGWPRFARLTPFFLTSASFGLQGILLNPNKDNDYTFRFTLEALQKTVPFYAGRMMMFPWSGALLLPLAFIRDRRIWFGLLGMFAFIFTLLFLPGRLYEAYTYLPLACAAIALAAAATRIPPRWALAALLLWMPLNVGQMLLEQRQKLRFDDEAFAFSDRVETWVHQHPAVTTLVYEGAPGGFHNWGITAVWNLAHHTRDLPALYYDSSEALKAMQSDTVAYARWDSVAKAPVIQIHSPLLPGPSQIK